MSKEPEQGVLGKDGALVCKTIGGTTNGCVGELIQLASTPFEKKAVIEFATIERKLTEELSKIKTELKYIKWLTITIFVTSVLLKLMGG
jgi:hypothetical protein